ncbi:aspartyl/lysyl-trna synthetase [Holotrichia oblita]|nr:aspartyl/lysyl-trna synthetase [Holotrichia oblita]
MRSEIIKDLREGMAKQGFIEISTPILTSSSPEGARDYIVPSRMHPGKFYALPQAPQQYKQILMCSGFDRYFQIAPCFRDEAARADRSPGEFYQLDMEMAFAEQEDVFNVVEAVLPPVFAKHSGWAADKSPFIRIPYREAMEKYGSDKPDLRNPLEITDATKLFEKCEFGAIKNCVIKAVVVKDFKGTRKQIDEICAELTAQEYAKAVYWFKVGQNNEVSGGIAKFVNNIKDGVINGLGLGNDSLVMLVANPKLLAAQKEAGRLRTAIGTKLDLLEKNIFRFCWIVDFPMYEIGEESGELEFCHNPFSMPQGGMDALKNQDPLDILAYQYDIICNGVELSSGAVRNHDPEIMIKAFALVGMGEDVVSEKFPAMFNAFKFGAPPHAGVAPGVDRMIMLICDTPNIREVIPFPMNKSAEDVLMNAPSTVTQKQLDDVHICIKQTQKK